MNSEWAVENLQAIRTLMERSAVYRRALAPIMTFTGVVGIVAALFGLYLHVNTMRSFAEYWMGVSLVALAGDFVLVRRQALSDGEPFWSPPTRRVTQALAPAFAIGLLATIIFMFWFNDSVYIAFLPLVWMLLYGCALHAAGFFMPRGIKLFAWAFLLAGAGMLLGILYQQQDVGRAAGHYLMGASFGGMQLAYGIYLYFTEKRKSHS